MVYRTQPDVYGAVTCVLCDRNRQEVRTLVQGMSGAVCSDCLHQALDVVEGGVRDPLEEARHALERSLAGLPETAALSASRAMVMALVALWNDDPSVCMRMGNEAIRRSNPAAALEALSRIPDAALDNGARIAIAVASIMAGDHRRGLAAIEAIDGDEPIDTMLRLINRAALILGQARASGAGPEDPAALEADLARARIIATEIARTDARYGGYQAVIDTNLAELMLCAGKPARAVALLREVEQAQGQLDPVRQLLLGDAYGAAGDPRRARERWERALAGAHAEGKVASAAKARLSAG